MKVEITAKYPNRSSNNLAEHTPFCLIRLKPEDPEEVHNLELLLDVNTKNKMRPRTFEKNIGTFIFDYIVTFEVKQE